MRDRREYRLPYTRSFIAAGENIFRSGLATPFAVLLERELKHNSRVMSKYCERLGVYLAPHGKTAMSPELWELQLRDGAWGITAANVQQARVMMANGVPRVLIANQVVAPKDISWMLDATDADSRFEVACFVDSVANVEILDGVLSLRQTERKLPVLVELGFSGGRCGVRSVDEGVEVARKVSDSTRLELAGTSGFEGLLVSAVDKQHVCDAVRRFCEELKLLTMAIDRSVGYGGHWSEIIVSIGGSAFFDIAVEALAEMSLSRQRAIVIRSGCYITHADGGYDLYSPMGSLPRNVAADERLNSAIEVWGSVLSRPQSDLAIVDIGKRDISADGGMPKTRRVRYPDGYFRSAVGVVKDINDQHLYLALDREDHLPVGSMVAFGVAHPCTTLDKWRFVLVVDEAYDVTDIAWTYF